jgi:ABC-type transport system substrate-binding protein
MAEDSNPAWLPTSPIDRRKFIIGGSAVVALAACGSDDEADPSVAASESAESASSVSSASEESVASSEESASTPATDPPAPAASGGILRVGTLGGANDILDGQHIVSKADIARQATGWEPLMSFSPDYVPEYTNGIAKDVTANAADNYTITLKDGVKFSNGNPVTADDVIYSMTRLLDPDAALFAIGIATNPGCRGSQQGRRRNGHGSAAAGRVELQGSTVRVHLRDCSGRL